MMDDKTMQSAKVLFDLAWNEDIGSGDITTNSLIDPKEHKNARFVAKASGVIAGLPIAEMVFRKLDPGLSFSIQKDDGSHVNPGDLIAEFSGTYRALLTGERIALNFLQHLSGIATYTALCMKEVAGTKVQLLDTRKTLPGFRHLHKYAVRMGGGSNHRFGLYDMAMIKDNHIKVAGGISKAVEEVRKNIPADIRIEVETTSIEEVKEALSVGVEIIMLDNMSTEQMRECVALIAGKAKVEASGNMTVERLREVAETGIDYISIGALTHSVKALDISQQLIG